MNYALLITKCTTDDVPGDNPNYGDGSTAMEEEQSLMEIHFNEESDEEDEREKARWAPFYALRNHRALGSLLPLTSSMLNLHNKGWQEDVENAKLSTKGRSSLSYEGS